MQVGFILVLDLFERLEVHTIAMVAVGDSGICSGIDSAELYIWFCYLNIRNVISRWN